MSEMSRNARRAMRAKIHRITAANHGKVDASSYGPEEVLNSEVKTGMRPISRRAYKKGGKVVAVDGADAKKHAGKKPRSGSKHLTVDALVNRNLKDANEAREGKKHVGALKTGGRAMKKGGGGVPDVYTSSRPTDSSGRPMSNKELNLGYAKDTPPAPKPAPKPAMRAGPSAKSVSDASAYMRNVRKHGGGAWEGSAKDESQDKKLAKKYGMSMAAWEKSKMDKKHDTQHSAKGLNKGGRTGKSLGGVLEDVGKFAVRGGALGAALGNKAPIMGGILPLAVHFLGKKKDKAEGPAVAGKKNGGGLYANIHAKQERIANGSKERMRKVGSKGAPTAEAFKQSARTAKAHGGYTSLDGEMQTQEKVGGRIAKQYGGGLGALEMNKGGRAKKNGKTDINITIMTGKGQPQMDPNAPPPMPQGVPVQMPPPPQPQAGPPMQMPPPPMQMPPPPMGGPGAGPAPMPRKAGGRTYRSYNDMDAGAGSGFGRLEKTEIQKRKK